MFARRLTGTVLAVSALLSVGAAPAFAVESSIPSNAAALLVQARSVAASTTDHVSTAAAVSGAGTDMRGDAPIGADIVDSELTFDEDKIQMQVTVDENVDLNDRRWTSGDYALSLQLALNKSGTADAMLVLGGDGHGNVVSVGVNQYGGYCEVFTELAGGQISLTADASCFYRPGYIAYSAIYGNFTKAVNGDFSEIDMAPDFGFSQNYGQSGGYWLLGQDGGVFSFGDAGFFGSTGNMKLNKPVVGMTATTTGKGYRFVASDGGVFSFGDAQFFGSTGALQLNQPIVGMAMTSTGNGYWLVAADGGIFAFGDAMFFGSTGGLDLNQPIVGMTPTRSGNGYWLVASDGGIFAFGDAAFYGSTGALTLNEPITALGVSPDGSGYYLLARDGGIFAFGDAPFYGSGAGQVFGSASSLIVGDKGYRMVDATGGVWEYGSMFHYGDLVDQNVWPNSPIIGATELPRS